MATGSYVMRDQYYGQRLILTLSRGSGNTVNYTLKYQSTGPMYYNGTATISGGTSSSVPYSVSHGGAFTQTIATGSYSNGKAHSLTAVAQTPWGGVPRVTASIGAAASAPAPPSNISIARTSDTGLKISFTKGARATSTQFTASKNGGTWYALANPTGTTQNVSGVTVNCYWRFAAYSKGVGGKSSVTDAMVIYTKPTAPSTPQLGADGKVSWTNRGAYTHGVEIQRSDDGGSTVTTTSLGKVSTWTDSSQQAVTTRYRVRTWAGPSFDTDKTYSDWSAWSEEARDLVHTPASIDMITVERSAGGVSNPLGKSATINLTGSYTSSSILPGNTWKLEYRYKAVGGAYTTWTVLAQNQTEDTFTRTYTIGGDTLDVKKSYILQIRLSDSFESTTYEHEIPVGSVALSLSKTGAAVGAVWKDNMSDDVVLQVGGSATFEGTIYGEGALIVDRGSVFPGAMSANGTATVNITFGAPFAEPPAVLMNPLNSTYIYGFNVRNVTTTGCTVHMRTTSSVSAALEVEWQAIGKPAA